VSALSVISPLSFSLSLVDGRTINMIGEAANYLGKFSDEQRELYHWTVAIRMLERALYEPRYLMTATLSFQTALAIDRQLAGPLKS
jgi:hypothetical protein